MYNFCDFTFRVQSYNIFLDCANILCKNIKKALLRIAKSRQNHVYCLGLPRDCQVITPLKVRSTHIEFLRL